MYSEVRILALQVREINRNPHKVRFPTLQVKRSWPSLTLTSNTSAMCMKIAVINFLFSILSVCIYVNKLTFTSTVATAFYCREINCSQYGIGPANVFKEIYCTCVSVFENSWRPFVCHGVLYRLSQKVLCCFTINSFIPSPLLPPHPASPPRPRSLRLHPPTPFPAAPPARWCHRTHWLLWFATLEGSLPRTRRLLPPRVCPTHLPAPVTGDVKQTRVHSRGLSRWGILTPLLPPSKTHAYTSTHALKLLERMSKWVELISLTSPWCHLSTTKMKLFILLRLILRPISVLKVSLGYGPTHCGRHSH